MTYLKEFPIQDFQEALLYWFERNMRDLPWRKDRDPYKIWVSEIMLQQTKVDTVIPYFERFTAKYPTLESLAEAPLDDVLKEWEGLGYYSRARNLHSAAQEVKERYGGQVPDTRAEISTLKGVGSYTAGAILSIAYGKREPAVDGNVMRVCSRIFGIDEDVLKPSTKRLFESLVRELIPEEEASYFNQALMELGALICTPKSPDCEFCPVREMCTAKKQGIQHRLPVRKRKKKPRLAKMVAGIVERDGYVLIRQRPEQGLLAGLFEFPNIEWKEEEPAYTISTHLFQTYGIKTVTKAEHPKVEHIFSHLIWDITVYQLALIDEQSSHDCELPPLPVDSLWVTVEELDRYAFSVAHQKIIESFRKTYSE